MSRKKSLRLIILGIMTMALIAVGLPLIYSAQNVRTNINTTKDSRQSKPALTKQPQPSYGYPVRLQIDSINVNAQVQYVGLTDSGDLASPSNITDVGWYKLGTRPGISGSSVLDGHFNGPRGQSGVFGKLKELKKGDIITTTDNFGNRLTFKVSQLRTYAENEQPAEVFKSVDNEAHLNLITCSGSWNAKQRSYSQRTVVFTNLVNL